MGAQILPSSKCAAQGKAKFSAVLLLVSSLFSWLQMQLRPCHRAITSPSLKPMKLESVVFGLKKALILFTDVSWSCCTIGKYHCIPQSGPGEGRSWCLAVPQLLAVPRGLLLLESSSTRRWHFASSSKPDRLAFGSLLFVRWCQLCDFVRRLQPPILSCSSSKQLIKWRQKA